MQVREKIWHLPLLDQVRHILPLAAAAVMLVLCMVMEICAIPLTEEIRDRIYSILGNTSFYVCILLCTVYGRKYGLDWLRSLIFSFCSFQIVFSWASVLNVKLDIWMFGEGTIASFRSAMLLPLLCLVLSRVCKLDTWNLSDYLTPYFFLHHGIVTFACWVKGCCAGKTWPWGFHNPLTGLTVFPVQLLIIILSFAVAYWGLHYSKKMAYRANGVVFANSLILYGFFRYLIELFTDDFRVFWTLSWLSVCSLAMIVMGVLVRYLVGKTAKTP